MRRLFGTLSLAAFSLLNACAADVAGPDTNGAADVDDSDLELTVQDLSRDLSPGMTGDEVRVLQRYLRQYGYLPSRELADKYPAWRPVVAAAPAPGDFDESTMLAVRELQKHVGLPESGTVDAATRDLLREHRCGVPEGLPQVDPREKFALAGGSWSENTIEWRIKNFGSFDHFDVIGAYHDAFDTWTTQTTLKFIETTSSSADIVMKIDEIDGRGGILAQAFYPNDGGDVEVDEDEKWSFTDTTPAGFFDLRTIVTHELGHSLGLDHSSVRSAVMFPTVAAGTQKRSLTQDDTTAISALYDEWEEAGGKGTDVAVGPQGSVWLLGSGAGSNHGVYIWRGLADGWERDDDMSGQRIAVGPGGVPWVVKADGRIYERRSKFMSVKGWDQVLGCAKDIGVGANGDVWVIGCTAGANGNQIWKYNDGSWDQAAGSAVRISVAPDGTPWVINDDGNIYRRTTNEAGSGSWEHMPGKAKDIGVGPEGDVWVIGATAVGSNFSINVWNEQSEIKGSAPARRRWVRVSGSATTVGVGPHGPWVITAANDIYTSER